MDHQENVILGIDIGGTNVAFGLIGRMEKKILWKDSIPIASCEDPLNLAKLINERVEGKGQISGIGIGAPNGNFYTGSIEFAPNLPWKGIVPLKKIFEEVFQVPVVVSNDANAAACGEYIFGHAQDHPHFLMLTLGTGVGSGIFVDGKLVLGSDGMAGELGHFMVVPNGRPCGCGRNGCLEAYSSSTALIKHYQQLSGKIEVQTAKEVIEKWNQGDENAKKVIEEAIRILGFSIANFVTIHSPDLIVLFGGWIQSGEKVIEMIREEFEKNCLQIYRGKVAICSSFLEGSDSALLGSSALALSSK